MQMKGFVALADFSVLILRIEPPVVSKAGVQKSVATSKRLSLFWDTWPYPPILSNSFQEGVHSSTSNSRKTPDPLGHDFTRLETVGFRYVWSRYDESIPDCSDQWPGKLRACTRWEPAPTYTTPLATADEESTLPPA